MKVRVLLLPHCVHLCVRTSADGSCCVPSLSFSFMICSVHGFAFCGSTGACGSTCVYKWPIDGCRFGEGPVWAHLCCVYGCIHSKWMTGLEIVAFMKVPELIRSRLDTSIFCRALVVGCLSCTRNNVSLSSRPPGIVAPSGPTESGAADACVHEPFGYKQRVAGIHATKSPCALCTHPTNTPIRHIHLLELKPRRCRRLWLMRTTSPRVGCG